MMNLRVCVPCTLLRHPRVLVLIAGVPFRWRIPLFSLQLTLSDLLPRRPRTITLLPVRRVVLTLLQTTRHLVTESLYATMMSFAKDGVVLVVLVHTLLSPVQRSQAGTRQRLGRWLGNTLISCEHYRKGFVVVLLLRLYHCLTRNRAEGNDHRTSPVGHRC
jgi:hypothetical protein